MLREAVAQTDWCEMTMSMMREKQYAACERRLFAHPGVALFAPEATDENAQALYRHSFDNVGSRELVTLQGLRARVMKRLPREAKYISEDERQLLERLLLEDGETELGDWDNLGAAEALVSRLWCSFSSDGERWLLRLPSALHQPIARALGDPRANAIRDTLYRFDATIHGLLYIAGLLHSSQPTAFFTHDVLKRGDAASAELARRYLQASYEYVADARGAFILLHPGLADPYRLVGSQLSGDGYTLELSQETLSGGVKGILPEEEPLHAQMCAALEGNLRPDYDTADCAEDLRMLAKQGVSYDEMESVMSSMLVVMPTEYMKSALQALYRHTPRWMSLKAAIAN